MLEYWKNGILGFKRIGSFEKFASFISHYSTIPPFQYSIVFREDGLAGMALSCSPPVFNMEEV